MAKLFFFLFIISTALYSQPVAAEIGRAHV